MPIAVDLVQLVRGEYFVCTIFLLDREHTNCMFPVMVNNIVPKYAEL